MNISRNPSAARRRLRLARRTPRPAPATREAPPPWPPALAWQAAPLGLCLSCCAFLGMGLAPPPPPPAGAASRPAATDLPDFDGLFA